MSAADLWGDNFSVQSGDLQQPKDQPEGGFNSSPSPTSFAALMPSDSPGAQNRQYADASDTDTMFSSSYHSRLVGVCLRLYNSCF